MMRIDVDGGVSDDDGDRDIDGDNDDSGDIDDEWWWRWWCSAFTMCLAITERRGTDGERQTHRNTCTCIV